MPKTPFTQETLQQILDDTGTMSYDLLMQYLPGWQLSDIKARLSSWRYRKVLDYELKDGELDEFKLLKNKKTTTEEVNEGRRLKFERYFKQIIATAEIIAKPTASDSNKLKAIQLQQEAMDEIPDFYYKELSELETWLSD